MSTMSTGAGTSASAAKTGWPRISWPARPGLTGMDAIALAQQILHGEVAGPVGGRRSPRPWRWCARAEDAGDVVVAVAVVVHGGAGHSAAVGVDRESRDCARPPRVAVGVGEIAGRSRPRRRACAGLTMRPPAGSASASTSSTSASQRHVVGECDAARSPGWAVGRPLASVGEIAARPNSASTMPPVWKKADAVGHRLARRHETHRLVEGAARGRRRPTPSVIRVETRGSMPLSPCARSRRGRASR